MKAYLKKIRGRWYIASGAIGFPTTFSQDEWFSKYFKDNQSILITTDKTESSICKIIPSDTGKDFDCIVYDLSTNSPVGNVSICYDFFVKLKITGEFYFDKDIEHDNKG